MSLPKLNSIAFAELLFRGVDLSSGIFKYITTAQFGLHKFPSLIFDVVDIFSQHCSATNQFFANYSRFLTSIIADFFLRVSTTNRHTTFGSLNLTEQCDWALINISIMKMVIYILLVLPDKGECSWKSTALDVREMVIGPVILTCRETF